MKGILIALQFLTILPVNIASGIEKEDFGRSLIWFPFVGSLIGLTLSLNTLLFNVLPQPVVAVFIIAASIILTGGIHLDGFADTCDGLYGFTDRGRALEIMRDSRIGAIAAAGTILLLLLQFSILSSLPQERIWRYLISMSAFARWSQVLACFSSRYARQEGKARYFIECATWRRLGIAAAFTLGLFILLLGAEGLGLFFISLLPILLSIYFIKRKIGGMTGDTIGAVNEVAQVSVLLSCLISWRIIL